MVMWSQGKLSVIHTVIAAAMLCAAQSSSAAEVVNVGELGVATDAPYYIALEKGFFAKYGLDVKLHPFKNTGEAMAPLSTGQLEVADGSVSASLFNALSQKWPVAAVFAQSRQLPGASSQLIAIRQDLGEKVKSFKDIKGLKIALPQRGGVLDYLIDLGLRKEGLTIKDIEIVYMTWPDMAPAFSTKAIDGGFLVEPFSTLYVESKAVVPFRRSADVAVETPLEGTFVIYNTDWAKKKPKAAKEFAVAHMMAARIFDSANRGGPERAEVIDILTKYTRIKDKALYDRMQWSAIDPDGIINKKSMIEQQDWYADQGFVKTKINVDAAIDDTFRKYAYDQLGPYKGPGKN